MRGLLPRVLRQARTFCVHPFQGKRDLLDKLPARLQGYAKWLPGDWRIVVVVDRDDDDCAQLKQFMEDIARQAGLHTRTVPGNSRWQIANRIAIEELEAWYFGDWQAVTDTHPRVSPNIRSQRGYRHPDQIAGGTWEAFERILKRHGYFKQGLRKSRWLERWVCKLTWNVPILQVSGVSIRRWLKPLRDLIWQEGDCAWCVRC